MVAYSVEHICAYINYLANAVAEAYQQVRHNALEAGVIVAHAGCLHQQAHCPALKIHSSHNVTTKYGHTHMYQLVSHINIRVT